jgi:hypothetical protein
MLVNFDFSVYTFYIYGSIVEISMVRIGNDGTQRILCT